LVGTFAGGTWPYVASVACAVVAFFLLFLGFLQLRGSIRDAVAGSFLLGYFWLLSQLLFLPRSLRVLGLETCGAAHDQGSAHGGTRIVRQSYFEGSAYVPLLRLAYEGWHAARASDQLPTASAS
jgi:hypothetical protein